MTHLGAFELTAKGVTLMCVFPGVDPLHDVVEASLMKIALVRITPSCILTYALHLLSYYTYLLHLLTTPTFYT